MRQPRPAKYVPGDSEIAGGPALSRGWAGLRSRTSPEAEPAIDSTRPYRHTFAMPQLIALDMGLPRETRSTMGAVTDDEQDASPAYATRHIAKMMIPKFLTAKVEDLLLLVKRVRRNTSTVLSILTCPPMPGEHGRGLVARRRCSVSRAAGCTRWMSLLCRGRGHASRRVPVYPIQGSGFGIEPYRQRLQAPESSRPYTALIDIIARSRGPTYGVLEPTARDARKRIPPSREAPPPLASPRCQMIDSSDDQSVASKARHHRWVATHEAHVLRLSLRSLRRDSGAHHP